MKPKKSGKTQKGRHKLIYMYDFFNTPVTGKAGFVENF